MKILDLYAGLGGTAKGIHLALKEAEITDYEYFAVEKDERIAKNHRENNPHSTVIIANAKGLFSLVEDFDFIWGSPPCQTHSRLNRLLNLRRGNFPEPDSTLWELIELLFETAIPFIIENVEPYYKAPTPWTLKIGRHCFWSNFPLLPFDFQERKSNFRDMTIEDLINYHQITPPEGASRELMRQSLRNCTHWSIAKGLFEQFLNPRQETLTSFIPTTEKEEVLEL